MPETNKNNKLVYILLAVIAASLLFVTYYFFLRPEPGSDFVDEGFVAIDESGNPIEGGFADPGSAELSSAAGRDLLVLLQDLRSISIDRSFLDQVLINLLVDQSHTIAEQEIGRDNPFAPTSGF